ncbi:hypothetical protein [Faecalibacterium langellae]|jgi:hypothetical protein|uniref:hypothetical protein n=1 Tax=Faecalibacterium langellae TaxID=3435293 RepID=UPI00117A3031|nr:hypothetical protein [Faecalibacterium prausnitzii]
MAAVGGCIIFALAKTSFCRPATNIIAQHIIFPLFLPFAQRGLSLHGEDAKNPLKSKNQIQICNKNTFK